MLVALADADVIPAEIVVFEFVFRRLAKRRSPVVMRETQVLMEGMSVAMSKFL
jgi:hypothetical protein